MSMMKPCMRRWNGNLSLDFVGINTRTRKTERTMGIRGQVSPGKNFKN